MSKRTSALNRVQQTPMATRAKSPNAQKFEAKQFVIIDVDDRQTIILIQRSSLVEKLRARETC